MNLTLSKKFLRWVQPETEQRRQDFRMCLSKNMANAEDITRTVKRMNGHIASHLDGMKMKDPA